MFNLDKSIAVWRRRYEHDRAFLAEDIRELEQHVRDNVQALVVEGRGEEDAFLTVMQEMGEPDDVHKAYRNVLLGKLKRTHTITDYLSSEVAMFRNYLKIAFRNLLRQKVLTSINVAGLSIGVACCLLLFLYIEHEWAYDRFHVDAGRIFRVVVEETHPDGSKQQNSDTSLLLGPALEQSFPGIQASVRLRRADATVVADGFSASEKVLFADATFFDVFSFRLLQGNPATALNRPDQVVITEDVARTYFGRENAIGRLLTVRFKEDERTYRVSAVAAAVSEPSSIDFRIVLPLDEVRYSFSSGLFRTFAFISWEMHLAQTYVRLGDPASAAQIEKQLPAWTKQKYEDEGAHLRLWFQPLQDVHHRPEIQGGLVPPRDPRYTYILAGIALLILAVAGINFTLLGLGQSVGRTREVGIRKAFGAGAKQVRAQFWGEAVLHSMFAVAFGVILATLLLPVFNRLTEQSLQITLVDPYLWAVLAGLILLIGLVAGGYPAFVLSHLQPSSVFRGIGPNQTRGLLRQVLVTLQFAISISLVAVVFAMARQVDFMLSQDQGFTSEPIVYVQLGNSSSENLQVYEPFRHEALRLPAVSSVSGALNSYSHTGFEIALQPSSGTPLLAYMNVVDYNYPESMGLKLKEGRSFRPGEKDVLLVNEAFLRALGWASAVGRSMPVVEDNMFYETLEGTTIVGVVKDYHFQSFREAIKPVILAPRFVMDGGVMLALVRLEPGKVAEGLSGLEQAWKRVAPGEPFQYDLLSDRMREAYAPEERWQALIGAAALMALLIACCGTFGLVTLAVSRRTKEIGIRKVLGASAPSIVTLLSKDFLKLVFIAFILAVPVAYFAMSRWLQDFA
ncbi:MAG TPA: ABC transporter permease, partial [Rhodothermales bacterium]|nr:ABC transporter permease [Rhodothermales bacterium]